MKNFPRNGRIRFLIGRFKKYCKQKDDNAFL